MLKYSSLPLLMGTWCIVLGAQTNLLHFGDSGLAVPGQAQYYLLADADTSHVGPDDELRRIQRSFWKKLFKEGGFDWGDLFRDNECTNCCNNKNDNNYNTGDGDPGYNMGPPPYNNDQFYGPFQPFQPFQPLPPVNLWRGFGFRGGYGGGGYGPPNRGYGPGNYPTNNYPTNNYPQNNGPANNYGGSGENNYNSGNEAPTEPYVEPAPIPPPMQYEEVAPEPEPQPQPPPPVAEPDNVYSDGGPQYNEAPAPSYDVKPSAPDKQPQILYQPIIYVSPQFQTQAAKKEESCESEESAEKTKTEEPSYEENEAPAAEPEYIEPPAPAPSPAPQSPPPPAPCCAAPACGYSPCGQHMPWYGNSIPYAAAGMYGPYGAPTPYGAPALPAPTYLPGGFNYNTYAPPPPPAAPAPLAAYAAAPPPAQGHGLTTIYTVIANGGNTNSPPAPTSSSYAVPTSPTYAAPPTQYAPPAAAAPALPAEPYIAPMKMSHADQPYRDCPELFNEYHHNQLAPAPAYGTPRASIGNTYINAQVIGI